MNYRHVGQSGLMMSEISYGSWLTFGNQMDQDKAIDLVKAALELGINTFDTANIYNKGEAETMLGKILPKLSRPSFIVASKAFWPMSDKVNDKGLSRKHLFDSVDLSLERLNLKYLDLFYCHRYDPDTPLEETLLAIEDLIRLGKILYWGTSEWEADQIAEAFALCHAHGWHKPVINQPVYNLLDRHIENRILPTTRRLGMGSAVFSPLAQGILTGKYSGGAIPEGSRGAIDSIKSFIAGKLSDNEILKQVDSMAPIATRLGLTMGQIAAAFVLHTPGVTSAIVGASNRKQLEENVKASGLAISAVELETLRSLFSR